MSDWAAILAGGSGTRFWPLSTPTKPKQLLRLTGEQPLLAQAVARLRGLIPAERVLIVTGRALVSETQRLLPELPSENVLAEPRATSTAPALAWATSVAAGHDASATILSLHADWYVGDNALFRESAARALDVARRHDVLVTVGMAPSRPDPGYGYIVPGESLEGDARRVERFIEKPPVARAKELIAAGALWNSGMFAWTAARFFEETSAVAPELAPWLHKLASGDIESFFKEVTPVAVDVSHFERSERVACVPGRFLWDDVGTWSALGRVLPVDSAGNVLVGQVFLRDADGCVAWAAEGGAVVLDGVSRLIVVQANGVTLVTTRERCDNLKDLLDKLPVHIRSMPK